MGRFFRSSREAPTLHVRLLIFCKFGQQKDPISKFLTRGGYWSKAEVHSANNPDHFRGLPRRVESSRYKKSAKHCYRHGEACFICGKSHMRTSLHPLRLIRNVLLELRHWIFGPNFGNFGAPFWSMFVHSRASRPEKSIPDDVTDLCTQNKSSGAHLRPIFDHFRQKCERFSIPNLNFKKSTRQGLWFLSMNFLFV